MKCWGLKDIFLINVSWGTSESIMYQESITRRFCHPLEKSIGVELSPCYPLSGEGHFQKGLPEDCFLKTIMYGTIQYGFMRKIIKGSEYQTSKAMLKKECNY